MCDWTFKRRRSGLCRYKDGNARADESERDPRPNHTPHSAVRILHRRHDALARPLSTETASLRTEIALVIAVGKTRGKLSQVAFADWLAAQRAERFWTGSPAVSPKRTSYAASH